MQSGCVAHRRHGRVLHEGVVVEDRGGHQHRVGAKERPGLAQKALDLLLLLLFVVVVRRNPEDGRPLRLGTAADRRQRILGALHAQLIRTFEARRLHCEMGSHAQYRL